MYNTTVTMKVFLTLVVVAVVTAQIVFAQKNGTKQMNVTKEKQEAKEKNNKNELHMNMTRNERQAAQFSTRVNRTSNIQKPLNISSNVKVPSNIPQTTNKESGFKLPNGIHLPVGVPTGIPDDIVGKATKNVKDRIEKSKRHKTLADYIRLKKAKLEAATGKKMNTI